MSFRSLFLTCATTATLLLSVGCNIIPEAKPDPTRFFVLGEPTTAATTSPSSSGAVIGLLPIEVPAYLTNVRSLAVSTPGNQVTFREFDRWAESLDAGITRVLQSSLAQSPAIGRVVRTPFPLEAKRTYDLQIRIISCEGFTAGDDHSIRFALTYSVSQPAGPLLRQGTYTAPPKSWDGDSGQLAALLSEAITAASAAIATDLP